MKILYCEVGKEVEVKEVNDDLKTMQELVGGYVEAIRLGDGLLLLCNEEGKIRGLEANRIVRDTSESVVDVIMGNFLICKFDRGNEGWAGLEDKDLEKAKACVVSLKKKYEDYLKKWSDKQEAGENLPCPRCGSKMESNLLHNSLSRYFEIYICSDCGTIEAMADYLEEKEDVSIDSWYAKKTWKIEW